MKEKIDNYSINLMWINNSKDENGEYVCQGKNRESLDFELTQLKKWCVANPEADVNFWYDSECTNKKAIENTAKLLLQVSDKIHLRDIREIPFAQYNADIFLPSIPIYCRIDFLKLIICLHLMENEGMDSVIYTDMSIGANVEKVLSKQELFNPIAIKNLNQYGMLIGQDTWKAENQFLQMLNSPELLKSMKHAINCSLFLIVNALNRAIDEQKPNILEYLYGAPFVATMVHVYMYLLVLHSKEPVKIRADVVKEGNELEWVNYNPEIHGYIMFGNHLKGFELGSGYFKNNKFTKISDMVSLSDIVKLPECLKLQASITDFASFDDSIYKSALRNDLNPSKIGSSHDWSGPLPLPTQDMKFHSTFWPNNHNDEEQLCQQAQEQRRKFKEQNINDEKQTRKPLERVQRIIFNQFHREFLFTIDLLKKKMDDFRQNPGFAADIKLQKAHAAASALHVALESEGNDFFSKPPSQNNYDDFKLRCKNHINDAREVLDKHRGWTKILINVLAFIATAGIGYIIAAGINTVMNRGKCTFFSTDSSQKISIIERHINNRVKALN